MPNTGYLARRRHPVALSVIIGGHLAALAALALVKTYVVTDPPQPPMQVENIPIETPPPPEKLPPPPDEVAKPSSSPPTKMTVVVPPVQIPSAGPAADPASRPYVEPFIAPPGPTPNFGNALPLPVPEPLPIPERKPAAQPVAARPRGDPARWVTNDDYPDAALRGEEQGRTRFRLEIGPDGRPTGCTVTGSSGSATLDNAACRLLMRRARFNAATGPDGQAVGGSYSNSFNWLIPED